jgi:hypothetical protein
MEIKSFELQKYLFFTLNLINRNEQFHIIENYGNQHDEKYQENFPLFFKLL